MVLENIFSSYLRKLAGIGSVCKWNLAAATNLRTTILPRSTKPQKPVSRGEVRESHASFKLAETTQSKERVSGQILVRLSVTKSVWHLRLTCGGHLIIGPFFQEENPPNRNCKPSLVRFETNLFIANFFLILETAYDCSNELNCCLTNLWLDTICWRLFEDYLGNYF